MTQLTAHYGKAAEQYEVSQNLCRSNEALVLAQKTFVNERELFLCRGKNTPLFPVSTIAHQISVLRLRISHAIVLRRCGHLRRPDTRFLTRRAPLSQKSLRGNNRANRSSRKRCRESIVLPLPRTVRLPLTSARPFHGTTVASVSETVFCFYLTVSNGQVYLSASVNLFSTERLASGREKVCSGGYSGVGLAARRKRYLSSSSPHTTAVRRKKQKSSL